MRRAGLLIAFASSWCFAFSGPMAKYLGAAGLAPLESVWARMAGAGMLLLAVLAVVRPAALRIPRSRLLFFLAYAVVAVAGVQALYFAAITRLPVGVTLLIEFTSPVLVVLWVRFVRRVRLPRAAFVGAVVAVAGLGIVVEVWSGLALDPVGLLLAFGAAACCAGYFLLSDGFGDDVDPLGLIAWGLLGAAVVLAPISRPWNIPWGALSGTVTPQGGYPLPVAGALAWMVVVATVVAYILGVTAVRRLSAAVGSTVASLEVIAGAVIAWILLGEALGPFQIAGGVIVLTGAYLAQRATAELPAAPPQVREPARVG
ncbi:drug/metabolite transporter (DMT)-like permease [Streptosporangium becharense]|uniref:Drug/metabolite transporter (DMT)-like permease n=1 Tax=Streptosporangium becharense TaxID=1816182 RepID=A0A7W9IIA8_9ACTN|nr:DMT family transporter [Streptosporangium becharense]MBB2913518.1 drug/metabolite transporter (DMT)-like permease [Streptosporangium becharense]MBB5821208.1 drug/metabolite transporter (DMT)-like permease [Streptosporangium becharense]